MEPAYTYTSTRGTTWYLYKKEVTLKNGHNQTIYFFSREADRQEERLSSLPADFHVVESDRTGLPLLKKN